MKISGKKLMVKFISCLEATSIHECIGMQWRFEKIRWQSKSVDRTLFVVLLLFFGLKLDNGQ